MDQSAYLNTVLGKYGGTFDIEKDRVIDGRQYAALVGKGLRAHLFPYGGLPYAPASRGADEERDGLHGADAGPKRGEVPGKGSYVYLSDLCHPVPEGSG